MRFLNARRSAVLALTLGFGCDNANVVASRIRSHAVGGMAGSAGALGDGGTTADTPGGAATAAGGSTSSHAGETGEGGSGAANEAGAGGSFPGEGGESGNASAGTSGSSGGVAGSASGAAGSGHDGGTGPGGDGGGGTSGVPQPSPVCDDGNDCTLDAFVDGACRNDPVADGTYCDDADFCSAGERCEGGQCIPGTPRSGGGEVLGSVGMYGSVYGYSGAPIAVRGQDRFVFFESLGANTRATVADAAAGSLRPVHTLELSRTLYTAVSAAWDGLVAAIDGDSSISIGGEGRMLQILSMAEDGALEERGTLELDGSAMNSMVGFGSRLFLCSNFAFFSDATGTVRLIDVSDPDAPALVSQTSLEAGISCGSMALSEDGNRLYVNTRGGVRFADITTFPDSGPLTFDPEPLVPVDAAVHVRGQRVLTRTGTGSEITVFDEASHAIEGRFTVSGANLAGLGPTGVFVQGTRTVGDGREFFAALYDFSGSLIEEHIIGTSVYGVGMASQRAAISPNYALAPFTTKLFQFTENGLRGVFSPEVGYPGALHVGRDGGVYARSRLTAHRIDVSDPTDPVIVAGGPHAGPIGIRLDTSLSPAKLLLDVESTTAVGMYLGYGSTLVEQSANSYSNRLLMPFVRADADERLISTGHVELPGGGAALLSAGDFVYRAELAGGSARFRRWLSADLENGITSPSLDLAFEAPAEATQLAFDVDPVARAAVVAIDVNLYRIDLAEPSPVVETITLGPALADGVWRMRVKGNWVVYTDGTTVGFMDLDTKLEEILDPSQVPVGFIGAVLAFDGTTAFLNGSYAVTAVRRGRPEQAFLGRFETPFVPHSLVETNGVLVVSSLGGIITAAPPCE